MLIQFSPIKHIPIANTILLILLLAYIIDLMSKRRHNLSIDHNSHTSKRLNQPMLADPPKKQVSPFKKVSEIPNIKSYVAIEKLRLGK